MPDDLRTQELGDRTLGSLRARPGTLSVASSLIEPRERLTSFARLRGSLTSDRLALAIVAVVAVGAVLRLAAYLANRSLWLDEAFLALNVIDRSVADLADPLAFNQGAPIGFLAVEKLVVAIFGTSEYAFRLVPLLAGIVALALFAVLARRCLRPAVVPLAVALLAVSEGAIYYSTETKQYSTDVVATLVLLLGAQVLSRATLRPRTALVLVAVALLTLSISHAAVIVAPTLAVVAVVTRARAGRSIRLAPALVGGCWVALAAAFGFFARNQLGHLRTSLLESAGDPSSASGAAVKTGSSVVDVLLGLDKFAEVQGALLGLPQGRGIAAVPVIVFVLSAAIGASALLRRDPATGALLVAPVIATLLAIATEQYPLLPRATLFLFPFVVLMACEGVAEVQRVVRGARGTAVAVVVALLFFVPATAGAFRDLAEPRHFQELRPALARIRAEWQAGDALYVYYSAQYAFAFYQRCECLDLSDPRGAGELWPVIRNPDPSSDQFAPELFSAPPRLYIGPFADKSWERYLRDVDRVRGRSRVWFVFTHASSQKEAQLEYERFPAYLDRIGVRKASFSRNGARVYLYDLRDR